MPSKKALRQVLTRCCSCPGSHGPRASPGLVGQGPFSVFGVRARHEVASSSYFLLEWRNTAILWQRRRPGVRAAALPTYGANVRHSSVFSPGAPERFQFFKVLKNRKERGLHTRSYLQLHEDRNWQAVPLRSPPPSPYVPTSLFFITADKLSQLENNLLYSKT